MPEIAATHSASKSPVEADPAAAARTSAPRWFVPVLQLTVGALLAGLLIGLPRLFSGWGTSPAAQAGKPVPVHVVEGRKVPIPAMRPYRRLSVSWPAAQTATAQISTAVMVPAKQPLTAAPSAGSARAGDTPV
jgi:hypothetical protein